jgi:hypothetical protein
MIVLLRRPCQSRGGLQESGSRFQNDTLIGFRQGPAKQEVPPTPWRNPLATGTAEFPMTCDLDFGGSAKSWGTPPLTILLFLQKIHLLGLKLECALIRAGFRHNLATARLPTCSTLFTLIRFVKEMDETGCESGLAFPGAM